MPRTKERLEGDTPWVNADPGKKIGINIPMPEPLMIQLDYLIQHRAIMSKASFIREVVEKAAEDEVNRLWKVREAVRRMEEEESSTTRRQSRKR